MGLVFEVERMERIIHDLKKYICSKSISIDDYYMIEAGPEKKDGAICNTDNWEKCKIYDTWNTLDSHRWYRTKFIIPDEYAGKHVFFRISTGREGLWDATNPQMLCFVNQKIKQGVDVNHQSVELSKSATAGDKYEIALLAYSGIEKGNLTFHTYLEVIDDSVEQLYYDLIVPLESAKILKICDEDNSRRTLLKMQAAINTLDFRVPGSEKFYSSIKKARSLLQEEFYTTIPENIPTVNAIGHTHIDVAWLWTVSQTREKALRSFSTVLDLMARYPDYKFMSSQPILYQFVKEQAPDIFNQIKQRVKEGRWEVDGAMWLEADCNLPTGESLVRQILKGEQFFEKEFNQKSKSLWLPDVFGYSAAIPQILKKCEIPYFMTTKIAWNQFNQLPNDTFMWKGLDGSKVFVFMPTTCEYSSDLSESDSFSFEKSTTTYSGIINPNMTLGTYKRFQNRELTEDTLMLYGFGDGGGGPTKEMLEYAKRLKYGLPGLPKIALELESDFFDKTYEKISTLPNMPTWEGELYFEYHRGTLTSMAKNKKFNRKNELLYEQLETLASIGAILGNEYPEEIIEKGWNVLLLNQFHDIIPGTAIESVYKTTDEEYEKISQDGIRAREHVLQSILHKLTHENKLCKKKIVWVCNTMGFERSSIVTLGKLDSKYLLAEDMDGNRTLIQRSSNGTSMFFANNVPALGLRAFYLIEGDETTKNSVKANVFENKYYKVTFNNYMQITSLIEKVTGQEMIKPDRVGNELITYEDRPMNWDNWDIDFFYTKKRYDADYVSDLKILENGPIRNVIEIKHSFMQSTITQQIILYNNLPRIDFHTNVDWREHNVLLRVNFPVNVNSLRATYEIQFGNIERETTKNHSWDSAKFEVCAHKWADLSDNGAGISILNDCKYGHSIKDGEMGLTLIKAGTEPNSNADIGHHEFTYSIYPHAGRWNEAQTIEMAYDLNVPLLPLFPNNDIREAERTDRLSFLSTNCKNCFIETIKKANDGNGFILRAYENENKYSNVEFELGIEPKQVFECNLLEKNLSKIEVKKNIFSDCLKPFEIKTYRLIF